MTQYFLVELRPQGHTRHEAGGVGEKTSQLIAWIPKRAFSSFLRSLWRPAS